MNKIFTTLMTIVIIYLIFKQIIANISIPENIFQYFKTPQEDQKSNINEKEDNLDNSEVKGKKEQIKVEGNFIERTISNIILNVVKTEDGKKTIMNLLKPINYPITSTDQGIELNKDILITKMFQIETTGIGVKGPASCGHTVSIEYIIFNMENSIIEQGTKTITLGLNQIIPMLDAVIVGMKTGQTRTANIVNYYPNLKAVNSQTSSLDLHKIVKVSVILHDIKPENFVDNENVKMFDNTITYQLPLLCGHKVICDAKITSLKNGEVLYNSLDEKKKINMNIGDNNYPIVFSHALHNKIPVGTRTVIIPGNIMHSFNSQYSVIFPKTLFNEQEIFMIEFFNFDHSISTPSTDLPHG